MDMSSIMHLVGVTYTQDAIGQYVPVPQLRRVFCAIDSVTQSEFFEAGRNGLKAAYRATMYADEYKGEDTVEYQGNRYRIYRTYRQRSGLIELYLEERAGVSNG